MKVGANTILLVAMDIDISTVDSVVWTLSRLSDKQVVKRFPDDVSFKDGYFNIPLYQEDTLALGYGMVDFEGQINYKDKAVSKTTLTRVFFDRTLNTEVVEGNTPSAKHDIKDVHVTIADGVVIAKVEGDVSPEQIAEAIEKYLAEHPIQGVTEERLEYYVADAIKDKADRSEIPSLDGYATETYVASAIENKADKSEIPSLDGYAKVEDIPSLEGYAKLTDIPSLDGYATEDWVEDKGYLTEHQPIKTINGQSLIGTGNIVIQGGGGTSDVVANEFVKQGTNNLESLTINSEAYNVYNADDNNYYQHTYHDIHVIPDKRNTGCDDSKLVEWTTDKGLNGLPFYISGTNIKVDCNKTEGKNLEGTFVIENYDFRANNYKFEIANGSLHDASKAVTITFRNCKMLAFVMSYDAPNIRTEFEHCEFMRISGRNSHFKSCLIGHLVDGLADGDAVNINNNSTMEDCYVCDGVYKTDVQGTAHIDGIQIYKGSNNLVTNTRVEIPFINYSACQGGMSYTIYIENSPTSIFEHCVVNGGGYYVVAITDDSLGSYITDAMIGECYLGNNYAYSNAGSKERTIGAQITDSVYVSSVWVEEGKIKFLATNDTLTDRHIQVITDKGVYGIDISKSFNHDDYAPDTKNFDDYPIDVEFEVEGSKYAVFFENGKQIRFANFTLERVPKDNRTILNALVSGGSGSAYVEGDMLVLGTIDDGNEVMY